MPPSMMSHGRTLSALRSRKMKKSASTPASASAGMFQHAVADLKGQVAHRHEVVIGLRWEADHVVELQVFDSAGEDQLRSIEDLVVGHRLVDHAAQTIGSGFWGDRDRPFAAFT